MLVSNVNENESTRRPPLKPALQGRLNSFQRTMLDWNDLHPYNAVHVVRISGPPNLPRLQNAINNTLARHGLASLTLHRSTGTFHYDNAPAPYQIKTVEAAENPAEALRAEIERQVNTGFDITGPFQPFRFFTVPEQESFFLGLVYFHAVADAVSIVQLLRQIYSACLAGNQTADTGSFPLAHHGFGFSPSALTRQLAAFVAKLRQQRRAVRVSHRNANDGSNRFEQLTLPPERLRDLSAAAKNWEVTLNDIFLAALLKCCSPFTLNRFNEPPRTRLAIGCIVNTRNHLALANPQGWGLFLGSFVVSHETPAGIRLSELARDIRQQTQAIKQRKTYAGPPVELVLGRFLLSFFSTEHRTKLYQKHYPLWGGITNMNLNTLWPQPAGSPPMDYFRGVSTGPVTPLVLSVTTVRDTINLGLTFRATTFTETHIRQVKQHLLKVLEQVDISA